MKIITNGVNLIKCTLFKEKICTGGEGVGVCGDMIEIGVHCD